MSDATLDASNASPSSPNWRSLTELLASMRFAISLLTVICIASVIGTVLKQHEPAVNYVNQFGPFWADLFLALKLNAVYSAWWFLLILAFLVVSTSLCVARHAPKYLADISAYKENIREKSLNAFHHKAKAELAGAPADEAQRLGKMLVSGGWKVKLQQRDTEAGPGTGWMLAAKAGAAHKIGYIAAHSSIVLICLGGLFDGDLIVRAQMLLGGKTPYTGGGLISEVAPAHRLSDRNPTFRANLLVAEGTQSSTAILNQSDGVLLQELPFAIELKKFIVEYYSTGMPKLFASDIVIHDKETGEKKEARVEVNHPASYKGVEIYQSSFDDGGSKVQLQARSFQQGIKPFMVSGEIGGSLKLPASGIGGRPATLEFTALRVLNVENLSGAGSEVDVRKVDLKHSIESRLGAGNKSSTKRDLRNVGPSITYKLRDGSGQAREFVNYMLPVDTGDGLPVYLLGVRETPAEPFRYLRVPVDPEGGIDGFLHLREALADSALREQAVQRYTRLALDDKRPELANQLQQSALRALTLFAEGDSKNGQKQVGLQAISDFIEANVPEAERARAGEVLVRILNGVLYELAQVSREKAGLKAMTPDEKTQNFMTQAVLTLSDVQLYPVPVFFELKNFEQVQASVFQVARAPGKNIVYLGCALLILGVFAMLYVRERRIWIWFTPALQGSGQGSKAVMALSTNRKTLDGDKEFDQLSGKLLGVVREPGGNAA
ncbi:cytochrome c biogenesis protein ResB [Diaphorobacter sp. HDW4A]|uniref:cytochrome c biogenesis protein ResB n=1 Tax=Diaphorobacter sp. HDW4A TaxID=2714924 RepID=UPI00140C6C57|nr:cytochrome c biogenesis protein ResB [Diaphorobacter sp. HDW4A]QIL81626.1 cytochrome c biogenesis protein ResB [Diaphorobacter sp. HDW4A]